MIKFFSKIKDEIIPYSTTLKWILIVCFLMFIFHQSVNLINTASTINVILGLCGIGMAVTFIVRTIIKKINGCEEKSE